MKIELPNEIKELGTIRFKEPVSINLYHVDRKNKIVYFEWGFGMDAKVFLDSYMLEDRASKKIKDKVLMQIQYDLGHAFFHYEGDPNYTYYHWALRGMLRDRVELFDEEFMENEITINGTMEGISIVEKDNKQEQPAFVSDMLYNENEPEMKAPKFPEYAMEGNELVMKFNHLTKK